MVYGSTSKDLDNSLAADFTFYLVLTAQRRKICIVTFNTPKTIIIEQILNFLQS